MFWKYTPVRKLKVLQNRLDKAIHTLLKKDNYLLINDLNEPCISHRLAIYLEKEFKWYDVDCEFNGFAGKQDNRKFIKILQQRLIELRLVREDRITDEEVVDKEVYPDIIIHKRGNSSQYNLLIIEIKKTTNKKQNERQFDHEKLVRYTSNRDGNDLKYQFGVFLDFTTKTPSIGCNQIWYHNGEILKV